MDWVMNFFDGGNLWVLLRRWLIWLFIGRCFFVVYGFCECG